MQTALTIKKQRKKLKKMKNNVTVIGAGLAGCEAAWQLAERGIDVTLIEMKPVKFTPAHHYSGFAELVCSNSLRSDRLENAVGLLKEELRRLGSLIMACADETRIPAGGALAVDRSGFSDLITEKIKSHQNITVVTEEVTKLPDGDVIIASGPLTSDALFEEIGKLTNEENLYFYDAAAPIVTLETVDFNSAYRMSRYGKGDDDYINCPMTEEEYKAFYNELINAECVKLKEFENLKIFEGCMPVEVMAKRGPQTLTFGPLKPVGLENPKTEDDVLKVDLIIEMQNTAGISYNQSFNIELKRLPTNTPANYSIRYFNTAIVFTEDQTSH